ncbi:MAG: serine hydrolase domain-containing protein [Pseudomonadota bacterium]
MQRLLTPAILYWLAWGAVASADLETLTQRLDAIRERHDIAAYAVVITDREKTLLAEIRGIADRARNEPVTRKSVFRIGSITKSFTGLALAMASERGLLSLESDLKDHIDAELFTNAYAGDAPVSIAQLLEHTSGLMDLSWGEMNHSDPAPIALADAVRVAPGNRQMMWPPGRYMVYSNAGAGLAALALENAAQRTFESFVGEEILAPLNMHDTSFFLSDVADRLITGYDSDAHTPIPYWHMLFRPFGALNTTVDDAGRFIRLFLNRGRLPNGTALVKESTIARVERAQTTLAAQHGLSFGYGLGVYGWYVDSVPFYGHGGDGDGYLAHFGYSDEIGKGYLVMINAFKHAPLREIRSAVERLLVAGRPKRSLMDVPLQEIALETTLGRYETLTRRFSASDPQPLVIVREGDKLFTRLGNGKPRRLFALGGPRFARRGDGAATIIIATTDGEQPIFQGERLNYQRVSP